VKRQIAELMQQNQMLLLEQVKLQQKLDSTRQVDQPCRAPLKQIMDSSFTCDSKQPIAASAKLKMAEVNEIGEPKQSQSISMALNSETFSLLKAIILQKEEAAEQRCELEVQLAVQRGELAVHRERERAFKRAQTEDLFRRFGF
jgi:hypothetical protein